MKTVISAVVTLSLCSPLFADVIISEIMYNPDSPEGRTGGDNPQPCRTEWVELYNAGSDEADLTGWTLADEDGTTGPLPSGTKLAAGEALVLIPVECDVAAFKEAWGDDFQVIPVTGWGRGGLAQLANSPSDVNEVLTVKDASGLVVDEVNFDDEGDWPSDDPDGPSIYLKPDALRADANDVGTAWARSVEGTHGGKANVTNATFTGKDVGSPGTVATEP